jgi:hypothetical protein
MKSSNTDSNKKTIQPHTLIGRRVLGAFLTLTLLCLFCCTVMFSAPSASAKEVQRLPHEPNNPKVLQVYFNTTDNREYIYNGQEWVPHDASIDTYVLKKYQKPHKPSNGNGQNNSSGSSDVQGASK